MNLSRLKSLIIIALAGSGLALVMFILAMPIQQQLALPAVDNGQATVEFTKVASEMPVRLRIPKIDVDTGIELMGIKPNGDMEAPREPQNGGWYKLGPHPGNDGSAVIAGHRGQNGISAVFDNLHKLQIGDSLYVEDAQGAIMTFVVREFRTYHPNAKATEVFHSSDGKAHLNLITCHGTWDKVSRTSPERLVVFTDRQDSE